MITWKCLYNSGIANVVEENTVICRTNFAAKGERGIVLISGKPGTIQGLDNGCIVSSRGEVKSEKGVYVMSSAAFKLFRPTEYADK